VDVALALLERAGDFCSEDIWHRVVQLVTNNDNMQAYAARSVVNVLGRGAAHESLMATAAYILGEYGKLIKVSDWNSNQSHGWRTAHYFCGWSHPSPFLSQLSQFSRLVYAPVCVRVGGNALLYTGGVLDHRGNIV
jgi:hypothetical protein